jgi:beta-barrel assembly-enhancing protease
MTELSTPKSDQRYLGRFSDGRSAASHAVSVAFAGKNLAIVSQDGSANVVWPLARVSTAQPVFPGSPDVMIIEPDQKGGTLFVADPGFIRDLCRKAPRVTTAAYRWQGTRPFLWVAGLTAAIATLVIVTDFSPARTLAGLMPRSTRVALGQQVITSMSGGHRTCNAAAGNAALTKLANRLSAASSVRKPFNVVVIESDVINAFAAPGEQIAIMAKLIDKAESPDEVAGVLAHEMGHGIELHPETGIIRSIGLMAVTEFAFGGSGGTIANVGLYLAQLGYSRQAERQADAQGLSILRKAQISNRGIIDFFERMSKGATGAGRSDAAESAMAMLQTHPSARERLLAMRSQLPYETTPALSPTEWQALRAICGTTSEPSRAPSKAPIQRKPPITGRDI